MTNVLYFIWHCSSSRVRFSTFLTSQIEKSSDKKGQKDGMHLEQKIFGFVLKPLSKRLISWSTTEGRWWLGNFLFCHSTLVPFCKARQSLFYSGSLYLVLEAVQFEMLFQCAFWFNWPPTVGRKSIHLYRFMLSFRWRGKRCRVAVVASISWLNLSDMAR